MHRTLTLFTCTAALAGCDSGSTETVSRCVPEGACAFMEGRKAGDLSRGNAAHGAALFAQSCARCHGAGGKGGQKAPPGGGASVQGGGMPAPPATDLTSATFQGRAADRDIAFAILRGRGASMPAFPLRGDEVRDLVAHVRVLGGGVAPPATGTSSGKGYGQQSPYPTER